MSKLTTTQLKSYLNGGTKAFIKPVFHLYVIENTKIGAKYVTVRQNMSGEAFMRIVEADSHDDAQRIPLLWSVRRFGISCHVIRRIASYTSKMEARIEMSRIIESLALKGLSLNGGRPRAGASETFTWLPEAESKKVIAQVIAKATKAPAKRAKAAKPESTTQASA